MAKPYEPRLATIYREEIRAKMKEQFGYKNEMQIPKIEKVVLNMGLGEGVADKKKVQSYFLRLIMIRSIRFAVWTLLFKPQQIQMKKPKHYWPHSRSLSGTRLNAVS